MSVAEAALSVTTTVSPVLYAVVLAVSQILSVVWAPTLPTTPRVKIIARTNAVTDFILNSKVGAYENVRPYSSISVLFPGNRTGLAIITSQKFKVQNINDIVVVQVCRGGGVCVVIHPDRHGIQLINDVVVIDVTSQQTNGWHGAGTSTRDSD